MGWWYKGIMENGDRQMGEFTITPNKTYSTATNARRAVAKAGLTEIRHFIMSDESGRFFPVFVGQAALQAGAHFNFNVVG
jgi:hypothetical protein